MPTNAVLVGPSGQTYADPKPSTDENAFQVNNTSDAFYNSAYYLDVYKRQAANWLPAWRSAVPR